MMITSGGKCRTLPQFHSRCDLALGLQRVSAYPKRIEGLSLWLLFGEVAGADFL